MSFLVCRKLIKLDCEYKLVDRMDNEANFGALF